jgi:hypothetical protein
LSAQSRQTCFRAHSRLVPSGTVTQSAPPADNHTAPGSRLHDFNEECNQLWSTRVAGQPVRLASIRRGAGRIDPAPVPAAGPRRAPPSACPRPGEALIETRVAEITIEGGTLTPTFLVPVNYDDEPPTTHSNVNEVKVYRSATAAE